MFGRTVSPAGEPTGRVRTRELASREPVRAPYRRVVLRAPVCAAVVGRSLGGRWAVVGMGWSREATVKGQWGA